LGAKIKSGKGAIMVPWTNGLNCYSFAAKCDMPGGTGAVSCVPGARAGASVTAVTIDKKSLYHACVADGFEDVSGGVIGSDYKFKNPPHCDNAHYLVAVFYDNRHSLHFARQLADGSKNQRQWVHKPSAVQDAHNMQNAWYLGEDISNVPWGPYFEFVAYLIAPLSGVTVNRAAF